MIIKRLLITSTLTGGLLASAAGVAGAATIHLASPAAATHQLNAGGTSPTAGNSSPAGPESAGEATAHESDGPGGHQDTAGQNTDHQFNGTE